MADLIPASLMDIFVEFLLLLLLFACLPGFLGKLAARTVAAYHRALKEENNG